MPPESVIASVRQEVAAIDPLLPVSRVKTLDDVLNESTASDRFNASLLGAFAGTALLLAAIGVAGVLAISVSRRTAEIGIRLALGAQSRDVLAMVLRQGLMIQVRHATAVISRRVLRVDFDGPAEGFNRLGVLLGVN